ncbi:2,3,4,5-tetrahydropyridine-2,6-dicarboxylate N-acetyltransferase [Streptomyces sp. RB5]|uniref:2,3,4,5-tetrahydropyridine-2,6-dicarboxylate N-acetyltransferase n=1 Tax=Streptomyces smaragdinus TaxID=2585196 RepID=A0A7K0CET3_9ACTN|nr:acyltransferase [Streptomyces smaragdinus]MQY11978.1 2,3,4,5-tetrahydropyridine-2,6-dicarboxylate N-acetyltransferase [Streptomyces smaragdinus]
MLQLHKLERYKDDQGNEIVYDGEIREDKIDIRIKGGSNNKLTISPQADIRDLLVIFTGDNGEIEIGPTTKKRAGLRFELRCGHDSQIRIGENVGCAGRTFLSAVEGVSVTIGDDVMFAKNIEVRGDDTHPIYDVRTEKRANPSQSIVVGEHVWIAKHAVVMGGVTIGNGSVIGFRSIVTSDIPNNVVAVGAPARVVRRDIAWERPEVVPRKPNEEYPRKGEKSAKYWNLTDEDAPVKPVVRSKPRSAAPARRPGKRYPAPVRILGKCVPASVRRKIKAALSA